jgi:hypothetical protein
MSTVKRISGSYTIQSINPNDIMTINTNTLYVDGNLVVIGNTTSVDSTSVQVFNANVILNSGISPSSPANPIGSYVIVDRGNTGGNASIHWSETTTQWQITNDGTNYGVIVASYNGIIPLSSNLQIAQTTVLPNAVGGYVTLSAGNIGAGTTGLYATNTNYGSHELISKRMALIYNNLL